MGYRSENADIYAANEDGSGLVRLTQAPEFETQPTWSPDGMRIAYRRFMASDIWGWELVVMNADGTGQRVLATDPSHGREDISWTTLSWSPDSSHIAFSARADDGVQVFVAAQDGTSLTQLTHSADPYDISWEPSWSPDGRRIVFAHGGGIAMINANGSGLRVLMPPGAYYSPTWSPDGRHIAFDNSDALYMLDVDDLVLTRLTYERAVLCFVWSPDGTRIAYVAPPEENAPGALFVVDVRTREFRKVVDMDWAPFGCISWQP
jgi:Tol biopolymer transport system component